MTISQKAASQAGWALISGGVNTARVEAHRLHHLMNRVLKLVESSDNREHLYQVAGDLILNFPKKLELLETQLDELGYALSLMGKDHLKDRLPISRRTLVEETVEGARAFGVPFDKASAQRVVNRYLARRAAQRGVQRLRWVRSENRHGDIVWKSGSYEIVQNQYNIPYRTTKYNVTYEGKMLEKDLETLNDAKLVANEDQAERSA